MTLQNLYEILSTTDFPVYQFESKSDFENDQRVFPYIVFEPNMTTFNMSSGTIWRKITGINILLFSRLQSHTVDAEKLEKVLIINKLIPTITYYWSPDDNIFTTVFDISITQEIDPETRENFNA